MATMTAGRCSPPPCAALGDNFGAPGRTGFPEKNEKAPQILAPTMRAAIVYAITFQRHFFAGVYTNGISPKTGSSSSGSTFDGLALTVSRGIGGGGDCFCRTCSVAFLGGDWADPDRVSEAAGSGSAGSATAG